MITTSTIMATPPTTTKTTQTQTRHHHHRSFGFLLVLVVSCIASTSSWLSIFQYYNQNIIMLDDYNQNSNNSQQQQQQQQSSYVNHPSTSTSTSGAGAGFPTTPIKPFKESRVLLGIFSMLQNEKEFQQRQLIRDTYLSTSNSSSKNSSSLQQQPNNFICSLQQLMELHYESNHQLQDNDYCRIVYTFVVGAYSKNTTTTTDNSNNINIIKQELMTIDYKEMTTTTNMTTLLTKGGPAAMTVVVEDDLTILNIQENMNGGKSPTWIRYSYGLSNDLPDLKLDYIIKMDSDTFLDINRFYRRLESQIEEIRQKKQQVQVSTTSNNSDPSSNNLSIFIYGGRYQRNAFNTGYIYLLNKNLAGYVSDCTISGRCTKYSEKIASQYPIPRKGELPNSRIEDMEMGMFVNSAKLRNKGQIQRIGIVPPQAFPNVDNKEEWNIRYEYCLYIQQLQLAKETNQCPTQEQIMSQYINFQKYYTMIDFMKDCPC